MRYSGSHDKFLQGGGRLRVYVTFISNGANGELEHGWWWWYVNEVGVVRKDGPYKTDEAAYRAAMGQQLGG